MEALFEIVDPRGIMVTMATAVQTNKILKDDRVERFRDLGFTTKEAEDLAVATQLSEVKTKKGTQRIEIPLHPSKVQKVLDQGCPPRTAVRIFGKEGIEVNEGL